MQPKPGVGRPIILQPTIFIPLPVPLFLVVDCSFRPLSFFFTLFTRALPTNLLPNLSKRWPLNSPSQTNKSPLPKPKSMPGNGSRLSSPYSWKN